MARNLQIFHDTVLRLLRRGATKNIEKMLEKAHTADIGQAIRMSESLVDRQAIFGLVVLHAMAEELPIVASREGSVPEIIQEGKEGALFPKGDAEALAQKILKLLNDQPLRQQMGQAARQRYLAQFTPQKYGERMIKAFEDIQLLS